MPPADHKTFDPLMPHRILVRHAAAENRYGHRTYSGDKIEYKCLFDDNVRFSRNSDGELVSISRSAFINTDGAPILFTDELTFLDGSSRPIANISTYYDADGSIHSVKVSFT